MQEKIVKYSRLALPIIVKYSVVFILLIIVAVTLVAVNKVNQASNTARDESLYSRLQAEINVVKFDEETIQDIRDLKESGAKIDSDFPINRKNPF